MADVSVSDDQIITACCEVIQMFSFVILIPGFWFLLVKFPWGSFCMLPLNFISTSLFDSRFDDVESRSRVGRQRRQSAKEKYEIIKWIIASPLNLSSQIFYCLVSDYSLCTFELYFSAVVNQSAKKIRRKIKTAETVK